MINLFMQRKLKWRMCSSRIWVWCFELSWFIYFEFFSWHTKRKKEKKNFSFLVKSKTTKCSFIHFLLKYSTDVEYVQLFDLRKPEDLISIAFVFSCQWCITFLSKWTAFCKTSFATWWWAKYIITTNAQDNCLCMTED